MRGIAKRHQKLDQWRPGGEIALKEREAKVIEKRRLGGSRGLIHEGPSAENGELEFKRRNGR